MNTLICSTVPVHMGQELRMILYKQTNTKKQTHTHKNTNHCGKSLFLRGAHQTVAGVGLHSLRFSKLKRKTETCVPFVNLRDVLRLANRSLAYRVCLTGVCSKDVITLAHIHPSAFVSELASHEGICKPRLCCLFQVHAALRPQRP